ncbi:ATP-dependent helicase HrpB [Ponticaulis sp.]|uniref:ATP-dependent helicase HrpB n=1 Tax=Ponticaulis sp. TaxID=2020902 RepID=UPI000B725937|nr:ATP-dependent helicase HrpB [Ponticaulis sp.]MAI90992.1 ATP-dependent helicase HrpB [Ponticaulis sp.]OUX98333.1 MAG: ATP-dependent helicase HrpB [Hyphomonadaceae bacterium TMED5]
MPQSFALPIDDVLDEIASTLSQSNRLVLAAPPGAGKTTKVPLHLLNSDWLGDQKIIMLEPRRIAARRAAERMASMLGEKVGETIGVRSRLDTRIGPKTRIEVVTEGVFTNLVTRDPELTGIGAVLFDEFHERSIDADLGLGMARQTQLYLNEDLRILVMSATLDTGRVTESLDAPLVQSEGRAFPVDTRYLGRTQDRLEDQMARAIRKAISAETGSILAFLPGAGEINRTAERLSDLSEDITICPLYGALSPKEQDDAIRPAPDGQRKIVLATDIAESSLTIEGVRIVVDAGFARVPVYSPGSLGASLATIKASIANVDQRRGRAGRTEPGVCYRLWHEEENRGLPKAPQPEILNTDLTSALLQLAEWGDANIFDLPLLDYPPRGHVNAARSALSALEFLDDDTQQLKDLGRKAARLPVHPRLASLILHAENEGERALGAQLAALFSEQGLGGRSIDLADRFASFQRDTSRRANSLKEQARKWAGTKSPPSGDPAILLARAWPDRITRVRPNDAKRYQLAGGGGARLPDQSQLEGTDWLIICETGGQSGNEPIIRLAERLDERTARRVLKEAEHDFADYDAKAGTVRARRQKTLGEIVLSETPLAKPDKLTVSKAVMRAVEADGLQILPGFSGLTEHLSRLSFYYSAFPDAAPEGSISLEDQLKALETTLGEWLEPEIENHGLSALERGALKRTLEHRLDWNEKQALDQNTPLHWTAPSGRKVSIDYTDEKAPLISLRVQDVYGLTQHPMICSGRIPLTLSLLSPAQRPVAITKDLPGFWQGGYSDMRKDMKGRYPKHNWPEDPASASPPPPRKPR